MCFQLRAVVKSINPLKTKVLVKFQLSSLSQLLEAVLTGKVLMLDGA